MTVKRALIDYGKLIRKDPPGALWVAGFLLVMSPLILASWYCKAMEGGE